MKLYTYLHLIQYTYSISMRIIDFYYNLLGRAGKVGRPLELPSCLPDLTANSETANPNFHCIS